jgi:hypothetical protein
VCARFEGDHCGASTGSRAGLAERVDLRVRRARAIVKTLANDPAGTIEDNGADPWVGVGQRPTDGKLKGTTHQGNIAFALWCVVLWCVDLAVRHVLPFVLDT